MPLSNGSISKAPKGPWADFAAAQILPDLGDVHFIARAITPPNRVRRFDTRFFVALMPPEQEPVVDGHEIVALRDAEIGVGAVGFDDLPRDRAGRPGAAGLKSVNAAMHWSAS